MRLKDGFLYALICGLFIAIFLIIYQPFGTFEFSSDSKYLFLSGYGLIVFVVMFFVSSVMMYMLKPLNSGGHLKTVVIIVLSFLVALIASFYYKQWYFQQPQNLIPQPRIQLLPPLFLRQPLVPLLLLAV